MKLFGEGKPLWGIDVGSRSVKGVRVAHTRRGIRLLNAAIYEYPEEGGSLAESISALLGKSLSGIRAAIHFTGKVSPVIRPLSLPVMPAHELSEAVRWEARKLTALPLEEVVIDFLVMGESEEHRVRRFEMVVAIVERAALLEQIQQVRASGLEVAAIDVAPLALLGSIKAQFVKKQLGSLLYIDIGAQKMEINILKEGILRFTRQVSMGGDGITQAVAQALGSSYSESERRKREEGMVREEMMRAPIQGEIDRLIVEIQRSVDYYRAQFRETGVEKILLMGGTPLLPGFLNYFSGFFEAPVELGDPFSGMTMNNSGASIVRGLAPRFSLAVGLALRKG
jgi:type IV pilus assembly protein PilM